MNVYIKEYLNILGVTQKELADVGAHRGRFGCRAVAAARPSCCRGGTEESQGEASERGRCSGGRCACRS